MISENFRKKFKKAFGENYTYSPEVKKILAELNATNLKGEPYSTQSIRHVFNGTHSNDAIEVAIMECYRRGIELRKKLESLKKSVNEK